MTLERFYEKISVDASGCWMWHGAWSGPYGMLLFLGKMRGAHVVSYLLHCGEIPDGIQVLHTCDKGRCVNPEHLFLGTQQDNMNDKVVKGRQAEGEDNGRAVLTENEVLEIRRLLAEGSLRQYEIANRFDVDPKTITNIKHRRQWRYLQ